MANLADLLVSYKQVEVPEGSRVSYTPPESRFSRLISYINNKKETAVQPEVQQEQEEPQWKWTLSPDFELVYTKPGQELAVLTPAKLSKKEWKQLMTESYRKLGLSDNAIKNLIAKNALESAWGLKTQGRHNYGNITTGAFWKGDYVDGKDHDSKGNPITNRFRSYATMDDFAKDEVDFLTRLYEFDPNDDIATFTNKLQGDNKAKRRYAGSTTYKEDVRRVYDSM